MATAEDLLPKLQLSFDQVIQLADAPVATLRAKSMGPTVELHSFVYFVSSKKKGQTIYCTVRTCKNHILKRYQTKTILKIMYQKQVGRSWVGSDGATSSKVRSSGWREYAT